MELDPSDLHAAIAHTGSASMARSAREIAGATAAGLFPATAARANGENTHTGSYVHTVVKDGISLFNPVEDAVDIADAAYNHVPGVKPAVDGMGNAAARGAQKAQETAEKAMNTPDERGWRFRDLFSLEGMMRAFTGM